MAYEGDSWRIKNGLHATLERQGSSQVDIERKCIGHWRVSPTSLSVLRC